LLGINLLAGAFNFAAFLFLYKGFSSGVMSIVAPIAGSYPIVTISFSILVFGATVGFLQGTGIAIVLLGIILSGVNLGEIRRLRIFNKEKLNATLGTENSKSSSDPAHMLVVSQKSRIAQGAGSALLSCLFFGSLYFFLEFVTYQTDFIVPVLFMRLSAAIISFALIVPLGMRFTQPDARTLGTIIFMGVVDTLGYLSFDAGVRASGSSLPIVATLSGLVGTLTILYASVFYKEKLSVLQWAGVTALTAGVLIVLYF
jgi:drug/metabolite transporter (DMT)-like permease